MMDMPVIPTARFESDIGNIHLLARNRSQIAIACEILRIGRIGLADGKDHLALESGLGIFAGRVLGPHALGQIECRPCLRPTGVETDMGDNLGYLGAGDTVLFCRLKMVNERVVRNTLTDKRGNRYQTAVAQTELVRAAPYFAEKDIVVELRKLGGELA